MYFDAQNLFSDKQALTATAVSANVVKVTENVGAGEPIFVSIHVVENFVGLTSLNVQIQSADSATGTFQTIQETRAIPLADLNSGEVINIGSLPPKTGQFLRLNYVVAGTATAGAVTAGIVWDKQTNGLLR